ncbi:helix-turn-helix domain-containing protein [Actinoplanes regularis]|uniref:helix-turn-helix domain-containing protein n=1 Tax=Actinoplanes regularis TaxID=52697 RepID=UPI003D7F5E17
MRFTYRLRPGRTAQSALLAEWGRCRWLWNEALHQQKASDWVSERSTARPAATAPAVTSTPRGRSSPRQSVSVPVPTTSDIRSPPSGTVDRMRSELGIPRIHPWGAVKPAPVPSRPAPTRTTPVSRSSRRAW